MRLTEFAECQEKAVRHTAERIATRWALSAGGYNPETAAREAINLFPGVLKGVSVREIIEEILHPGSFGNVPKGEREK